jgi:hypothetical protein
MDQRIPNYMKFDLNLSDSLINEGADFPAFPAKDQIDI